VRQEEARHKPGMVVENLPPLKPATEGKARDIVANVEKWRFRQNST